MANIKRCIFYNLTLNIRAHVYDVPLCLTLTLTIRERREKGQKITHCLPILIVSINVFFFS